MHPCKIADSVITPICFNITIFKKNVYSNRKIADSVIAWISRQLMWKYPHLLLNRNNANVIVVWQPLTEDSPKYILYSIPVGHFEITKSINLNSIF